LSWACDRGISQRGDLAKGRKKMTSVAFLEVNSFPLTSILGQRNPKKGQRPGTGKPEPNSIRSMEIGKGQVTEKTFIKRKRTDPISFGNAGQTLTKTFIV